MLHTSVTFFISVALAGVGGSMMTSTSRGSATVEKSSIASVSRTDPQRLTMNIQEDHFFRQRCVDGILQQTSVLAHVFSGDVDDCQSGILHVAAFVSLRYLDVLTVLDPESVTVRDLFAGSTFVLYQVANSNFWGLAKYLQDNTIEAPSLTTVSSFVPIVITGGSGNEVVVF
jgi:hypothetical protein